MSLQDLGKSFSVGLTIHYKLNIYKRLISILFFRKTILSFFKNPLVFLSNLFNNRISFNDFSKKLSLMPLVLFSFDEKSKNSKSLLYKAHNCLKTDEKNDKRKQWIFVAEEYLMFFHPNGLLNSILKNKNF